MRKFTPFILINVLFASPATLAGVEKPSCEALLVRAQALIAASAMQPSVKAEVLSLLKDAEQASREKSPGSGDWTRSLPPPSRTCFAAGTKILTPDGDIAIENLSEGMPVLSMDVQLGTFVITRVRKLHQYRNGTMVRLKTRGGPAIHVNPRHHFFHPASGAYQPLLSLPQGEQLIRASATRRFGLDQIFQVEPVAGTHELYDLELDEEPHNFFADGILVHNIPIIKPI